MSVNPPRFYPRRPAASSKNNVSKFAPITPKAKEYQTVVSSVMPDTPYEQAFKPTALFKPKPRVMPKPLLSNDMDRAVESAKNTFKENLKL